MSDNEETQPMATYEPKIYTSFDDMNLNENLLKGKFQLTLILLFFYIYFSLFLHICSFYYILFTLFVVVFIIFCNFYLF